MPNSFNLSTKLVILKPMGPDCLYPLQNMPFQDDTSF